MAKKKNGSSDVRHLFDAQSWYKRFIGNTRIVLLSEISSRISIRANVSIDDTNVAVEISIISRGNIALELLYSLRCATLTTRKYENRVLLGILGDLSMRVSTISVSILLMPLSRIGIQRRCKFRRTWKSTRRGKESCSDESRSKSLTLLTKAPLQKYKQTAKAISGCCRRTI